MDNSQDPQEQSPDTAPDNPPEQSQPINFADTTEPKVAAVVTDEAPEGFQDPVPEITERELYTLQREAQRENEKRDFFAKLQAARAPKPQPEYVPPPLAPRLAEQIKAELAAGAAAVARHEENRARRPQPAPNPEPWEGKVEAVFRPRDYVPDQKKGQGNVQARNL